MLNVRKLLASILILALALAGVRTVMAQENDAPSLTVEDQTLYITVDTVVSDGPGWVVVYNDQDGEPYHVIGVASVEDGENTDVEVELYANDITETVYVMLHEDTGQEGTFEYGQDDLDRPVTVNGERVMTEITFAMPEALPDTGIAFVDEDVEDPDVDPTPTPVDEVDDDNDVDPTPTPEDEDVDPAEVEETPTPTPTPEDEEVVDEEVDATPTPDDEEPVEVIPELGANVSMLPMLGLAAAGALLLGVGFVFAYRKED